MAAYFCKILESGGSGEAYPAETNHNPENERAIFIGGGRLHRTPAKAKKWMTGELPMTDTGERSVIFTPLDTVREKETPAVVVFAADPLQLVGLITLVAAVREGIDPLLVPPMAACQQIRAYGYHQARQEHPRAVLGNTDLAARADTGSAIPENIFTPAVPFSLFLAMEEEAGNGVFDGPIRRNSPGPGPDIAVPAPSPFPPHGPAGPGPPAGIFQNLPSSP